MYWPTSFPPSSWAINQNCLVYLNMPLGLQDKFNLYLGIEKAVLTVVLKLNAKLILALFTIMNLNNKV
jgi:hypothetical protein